MRGECGPVLCLGSRGDLQSFSPVYCIPGIRLSKFPEAWLRARGPSPPMAAFDSYGRALKQKLTSQGLGLDFPKLYVLQLVVTPPMNFMFHSPR